MTTTSINAAINQRTEASIAKSIGNSLMRSGYGVPESVILSAVADLISESNKNAPVVDFTEAYDSKVWFFLRLAHLLGNKIPAKNLTAEGALEWALSACGTDLEGMVMWGGWNIPASLNLKSSTVDAGEFNIDDASTCETGYFSKRFSNGTSLKLEIAYNSNTGWYLTAHGILDARAALAELVSKKELKALMTPVIEELTGEPVTAKMHTDDGVLQVNFDARAYLVQANKSDLVAIAQEGFQCGYATDAIAEYSAQSDANKELQEAFQYISALQRNRYNEVGFYCSINAQEMLAWLAINRTSALESILFDYFDVDVYEEVTAEGVKWGWDISEKRAAMFDTKEQAVTDAYTALNFLGKFKDL